MWTQWWPSPVCPVCISTIGHSLLFLQAIQACGQKKFQEDASCLQRSRPTRLLSWNLWALMCGFPIFSLSTHSPLCQLIVCFKPFLPLLSNSSLHSASSALNGLFFLPVSSPYSITSMSLSYPFCCHLPNALPTNPQKMKNKSPTTFHSPGSSASKPWISWLCPLSLTLVLSI